MSLIRKTFTQPGTSLQTSNTSFWKNALPYFASFETAMVVFLFAGQLKSDPIFAWLPVDLTLLSFVISGATGMYLLMTGKCQPLRNHLKLVSCLLLFFTYYGFTFAWSNAVLYGMEKLVYMMLLTAWASVGSAFVIATDFQRWQRFVVLLFALTVVFALRALTSGTASTAGSVETFGANYLAFGRICGIGAVLSFAFVQHKNKSRPIYLAMLALFFYLQLVSGGRGPLINLCVVLGIGLVFVFWSQGLLQKLLLTATIACAIVGISSLPEPNISQNNKQFQTISRISLALSGENSHSAGARLYFYQLSQQFFLEAPFFGSGIGSWQLRGGWADGRADPAYPHNLTLEVAVEAGIVGVLLLYLPILFALNLFWMSKNPQKLTWLMLLAFTFFNAQVSGDINDNRFLFSVLALAPIITLKTGKKYA